MCDISSDSYRRAQRLYDYKLYSVKQVRTFSKYAWKTSKELSDKHGGSRVAFWVDMMWCNLRYGAMHCRDYVEFEFFRRSGRDRDNYITMRRYYKLIQQLDKDTFFNLIDKASVYKQYAQYIKRDWLLVDAQTTECHRRVGFPECFEALYRIRSRYTIPCLRERICCLEELFCSS